MSYDTNPYGNAEWTGRTDLDNHDKIFSCQATASMSNIIGGLTYVLKDFLLTVLPKGMIKNIWVDGQMVSTEMNSYNTFKPQKPILGIKPIINGMDFDLGDSILPSWHRVDNFSYTDSYHYYPIIGNHKEGIHLYAIPYRLKINFDLSFLFNTHMQQIDSFYQIYGILPFKKIMKLNTYSLELPIPRLYIDNIRKALNLDNYNSDDIFRFNEFIDNSSRGFFYKKKVLGTGKEEYVYQFKPIITTIFSDLSMDSGETVNQINTNYRIETNVSFETWEN